MAAGGPTCPAPVTIPGSFGQALAGCQSGSGGLLACFFCFGRRTRSVGLIWHRAGAAQVTCRPS